MYELTCPYCDRNGFYWEVEGHFRQWVPYDCEYCGQTFYVFHQSFFDLSYDTTDVKVATQSDIDALVAKGELKRVSA